MLNKRVKNVRFASMTYLEDGMCMSAREERCNSESDKRYFDHRGIYHLLRIGMVTLSLPHGERF